MNMIEVLKLSVLLVISAVSCNTSKIFSRLILSIALSCASLSANADYTFSLFDKLGASSSHVDFINNSGQAVGSIVIDNNQWHAMLWTTANSTDLGTQGGLVSCAHAINSSGKVVGYDQTANQANTGDIQATLWNNGNSTNLGTLGGTSGWAYSINDTNQVVGASFTSGGSIHATLWSNGTIIDLGVIAGDSSQAYSINGSGQIVGVSSSSNISGSPTHATLWSTGSVSDLGTLGGNYSGAVAINGSGQIVGYSSIAGDVYTHATLWSNGVITDLGTLGGPHSAASSINSSGQVVGWSNITGDFSSHATLWNNGTAIDLNSFLSANDKAAGWVLNNASGINDSGFIVGTASNSILGISSQGFLLSVVAPKSPPKTTTWEGQSPIDFNTGNVISAANNAAIQYHYAAQAVTLKNTADATIGRQWGSLVATPANTNSYVTVGGDKYVLKEFHFHTASEHTVNGVHNPMEMHLVHLKVHDNGKPYCYGEPGSLLVISALINDGGSKKNVELDKIFGLSSLASLADGATYSGAIPPINIQKVLPSNGAAYRYHGSLTEPTNVSCDASVYANTNYNSTAVEQLADHRFGNDGSFPEAVSWVVLSTPITLSTAQITLFKTLFPTGGNTPNGNSRPTQNQDHTQPAIVRNTDRKVLLIK